MLDAQDVRFHEDAGFRAFLFGLASRQMGKNRHNDVARKDQMITEKSAQKTICMKNKHMLHMRPMQKIVAAAQGFAVAVNYAHSEDGANLLTAYRRASNIVRIEEKRDGASYQGEADGALLAQPEESELVARLSEVSEASAAALDQEAFAEAMSALARLRAPVDHFFDEVTVNADDAKLRRNRLRLLSQIRATLGAVADFSQIEG